jgi:hypothetical protein
LVSIITSKYGWSSCLNQIDKQSHKNSILIKLFPMHAAEHGDRSQIQLKPNSLHDHTGDATTLSNSPVLHTRPEEGNDDPDQVQDDEETQLSGHNDLNINMPHYHTKEGCKPELDPEADDLDNDSLSDLLDSTSTLANDEEDDYDTIVYTRRWDDHGHGQVQDEQEIPELADADIAKLDRPQRSRNNPTLLYFDFNSQDRKWTESRSQAKKILMKA